MKIEIKDIIKNKQKFNIWFNLKIDEDTVKKDEQKKLMNEAKNDLIIAIVNDVFSDLKVVTMSDLTWHNTRDEKLRKYCDKLKNILSDIKSYPRVQVDNEVPLSVWEDYSKSAETLKRANLTRNDEINKASQDHKKAIINADKRLKKSSEDLHVTFKITKMDFRYLPISTRHEFREEWGNKFPNKEINSSDVFLILKL